MRFLIATVATIVAFLLTLGLFHVICYVCGFDYTASLPYLAVYLIVEYKVARAVYGHK